MKSEILERFEKNLLKNRLLVPREMVFIACSGGPDSVALTLLLKELQPSWKWRLGILHLNHGLRGKQAKRDAEFVKKMAKRQKLLHYSETVNTKKMFKGRKFSPEEAARFARYDFFARAAKKLKIRKIVTAHTANDQAETILMRLIQGTGLSGLCGIREKMKRSGVVFVRPLLEFSKKETLNFLKENKAPFCRDETNQSEKFLRNRIRHQLIPLIEEKFNPRIMQALCRIPKIMSQEESVIRLGEQAAWEQVFKTKKPGKTYFKKALFMKLPPALQFRVMDRGLRQIHPQSGLNYEAWKTIQENLRKSRYRHSLPKDIDFILTPSDVMLYKKS